MSVSSKKSWGFDKNDTSSVCQVKKNDILLCCSSVSCIAVINTVMKCNLRKGFASLLHFTDYNSSPSEVRVRIKDKNLKARTEANTMEKGFLLTCSPGLAQLHV